MVAEEDDERTPYKLAEALTEFLSGCEKGVWRVEDGGVEDNVGDEFGDDIEGVDGLWLGVGDGDPVGCGDVVGGGWGTGTPVLIDMLLCDEALGNWTVEDEMEDGRDSGGFTAMLVDGLPEEAPVDDSGLIGSSMISDDCIVVGKAGISEVGVVMVVSIIGVAGLEAPAVMFDRLEVIAMNETRPRSGLSDAGFEVRSNGLGGRRQACHQASLMLRREGAALGKHIDNGGSNPTTTEIEE